MSHLQLITSRSNAGSERQNLFSAQRSRFEEGNPLRIPQRRLLQLFLQLSLATLGLTFQLEAMAQSVGGSAQVGASGTSADATGNSSTESLSVSETRAVREKPEVSMAMKMEGRSYASSLADRKDGSDVKMLFGLHYQLSTMTEIVANPYARFNSGFVQSATATNGREATFGLEEGDLRFSDQNYFKVAAGVLRMAEYHSPLLVHTPLSGLLLSASSGERQDLAVSLFGYGGIPGSANSTSAGDNNNKTPSYLSAGVRVRGQISSLKGYAQAARFQYQNLPRTVASDSTTLGNTGYNTQSGFSSVDFLFGYQGLELTAGLDWQAMTSLRYGLRLASLSNGLAPSGYNRGYSIENNLAWQMNGQWEFLPNLTYFFIEPDATVANFNHEDFGTARVGYNLKLNFKYKNLLTFGGTLGERRAIYENDVGRLGNDKYVGVVLETLSAVF
ncbi:MAG: hypothetical protein C5B49_12170 [Bdellovibrio sp.]|nr:MAG: hypothetical protein C5B49_12170 [Bdellovibrio sp.]